LREAAQSVQPEERSRVFCGGLPYAIDAITLIDRGWGVEVLAKGGG